MSDTPKYNGMHIGKFSDDFPGYITVVRIKSDGQNFFVEIGENCIPYFTEEVLETMQYILKDAFFRVRPDLRKQ